MEAASKSWLLFSRHQEALEETPPLSKSPAGTLTVTVGRPQPPHLARPSRQEGAPALQPQAQGFPARTHHAGRLGWEPTGYFSEAS